MQDIVEFRNKLQSFAERLQRVRGHINNEEQTKVTLILPFIAMLGYDDRDPTEVSAEHAADFSEKYKNRVDYAILRDMKPLVAIECKSAGGSRKDDRGQLKAYFNASKTVKLGILTDGVIYEFFVDSEEPNMMDDNPFLVADFDQVAKGQLSETLVGELWSLHKAKFDPESLSENARRNITHRAFVDYLTAQFSQPGVEFTRFLLKENDIKHVRQNAVEGYQTIAKAAFDEVFTKHLLRRLDISGAAMVSPPPAQVAAAEEPQDAKKERGVVTTENELRAFESLRIRLAFLSNGRPELFAAIPKVAFRDYIGKMVVFFERERSGRLLEIVENSAGAIRYTLADGIEPSQFADLADMDERLRALFEKRVIGDAPVA